MKKKLILCLFIIFILTGCSKNQDTIDTNSIEIQLDSDVVNPLEGIEYAYCYECTLKNCLIEEELDGRISITKADKDYFLCDGIVISDKDVYELNSYDNIVLGTYGINGEYYAVPYGLKKCDTNSDVKDFDVLTGYLEEYLNKYFIFDMSLDDGVYVVTKCGVEYVKQCQNNDCYLIPAIKYEIEGYGDVYIDINSGCIIW